MVALATELVPFDGISFTAAALVGPLGVALALVTAADVALGDDVLVMGTGAIGLMAIRLAKARGAHRVFAAQRSGARRRLELAQELGADVLIHPDEVRLVDHPFPRGGVDRVLVTTPPALIGSAVRVCRNGGVIAYAGAGCGEQARITIDGNRFRERGLALRGTGNPDVSAYRRCVDLIRAGVLDAERLVSHTFLLEEIPQAFRIMSDDRQNRVKLVMVKD
jgi:L-iditol 2-dehydrogenase